MQPPQLEQSEQNLLEGGGGQVGQLVDGLVDDTHLLTEGEDDFFFIDDMYTSKLSAEAKARLKAKQQMLEEIKKQVLDHPEETADLLRSWIAEDMAEE